MNAYQMSTKDAICPQILTEIAWNESLLAFQFYIICVATLKWIGYWLKFKTKQPKHTNKNKNVFVSIANSKF